MTPENFSALFLVLLSNYYKLTRFIHVENNIYWVACCIINRRVLT